MYNFEFVSELSGHSEPIYRLLNFDENRFISTSGDGVIALWDFRDFSSIAIAKNNAGVYAVEVNNDRIVMGNIHGEVHFVNIEQKQIIGMIKLSSRAIFDIKYINSLDVFLVADGEGNISIISAQDCNLQKKISVSDKALRCIAVNASEQLLAVGSSDHTIRVFSLPTISQIAELKTFEQSVFTCMFIDDTRLVAGGRDAHIRLFDVINQEEVMDIPAHLFTVNTIIETDQFFVTGSRDKSFKVWDKQWNLKKVYTQEKYPTILKHSINSALYKQGFLFLGGDDRMIKVWKNV